MRPERAARQGPHPSWNDPARGLSAPGCSHGQGWHERCQSCRRRADAPGRGGWWAAVASLVTMAMLVLALGLALAVVMHP